MSRRAWLIALTALALGAIALLSLRDPRPATAPAADSALGALSAQAGDEGFARAETPIAFEFPRDHGPHPRFRAEWWYFTGHLADRDGRPFGFQLTLFRFALAPTSATSESAWRSAQVMLGHFAVSDLAGGAFHPFERLSRAMPDIAGSQAEPEVAVWLDDWRIEHHAANDGWRLRAGQDGVALDLALEPRSAVVPQGERGLSRKSEAPGNASYYYSVPRLAARGTLTLADGEHAVTGNAWLDREWSTSALSRDQAGWDWFALQLADGANLMFYRLRDKAGGSGPLSAGSHVDAAGTVTLLAAGDVQLTAEGEWRSPASGRRYPRDWRLAVPRLGLDLRLQPRLADQEWRRRFAYWEGAVSVHDAEREVGLGYVEMTGY